MTYNDASPYKPYPGNHQANIVFTACISILVQKLLSTIFFIVLCRSCLLCTVGLSCNLKSGDVASAPNPSLLQHHVTRGQCLATVTALGRGHSVGYIIEDRRPLYQQSKWKQDQANIKLHLHDKGSIDDAIPHWEAYGVTPFMPCQRSMLNGKHIFSLDLGDASFQNSEQLGFILVQNNRDPVDLINHLLEKFVRWTGACMHIQDGLICSGVIKKGLLQSECCCDAAINNYSTIYCYIKKDHHYCFIPLENIAIEGKRTHSLSNLFYHKTPQTSIERTSLSLERGVAALPVSPLSLKKDAPSDAPPMAPVEAEPICMNDNHTEFRQLSLLEEIKGACGDLYGGRRVHNGSFRLQDAQIGTIGQKPLPKRLKNVQAFKRIYKEVTNIVEIIDIESVVLSDLVKNTIKLSPEDKIAPGLATLLESIKSLKSSLVLEKECQQGVEYRQPTSLSMQRSTVVKKIENVQKALCEEYVEVLSAEVLLNQCIAFLSKMYDLLFDTRRLYSLNPTDGIMRRVKQWCMGDKIPLEKAQNIIDQLEKLEDKQLSMIRYLRKIALERQEALIAVQAVVTLIANLLQNEMHNISLLNLKRKLMIHSKVVEGKVKNLKSIKEMITDLDLDKADIRAIQADLHSADLKMLKIKIEKKIEAVTNQALHLTNKIKTDLPLKAKNMVDQAEQLQELCMASLYKQ